MDSKRYGAIRQVTQYLFVTEDSHVLSGCVLSGFRRINVDCLTAEEKARVDRERFASVEPTA